MRGKCCGKYNIRYKWTLIDTEIQPHSVILSHNLPGSKFKWKAAACTEWPAPVRGDSRVALKGISHSLLQLGWRIAVCFSLPGDSQQSAAPWRATSRSVTTHTGNSACRCQTHAELLLVVWLSHSCFHLLTEPVNNHDNLQTICHIT